MDFQKNTNYKTGIDEVIRNSWEKHRETINSSIDPKGYDNIGKFLSVLEDIHGAVSVLPEKILGEAI